MRHLDNTNDDLGSIIVHLSLGTWARFFFLPTVGNKL